MKSNNYKIENIISNYILKFIFRQLSKARYLEIIKNNKKIQKRVGVNIKYYKKESQRLKIIEKNGKGKEYRLGTDILLFEGQYLNGKKSGKGIEYYENGEIKFEGIYLNGKKIKGKGYDSEGNKNFILKGNGKGKEIYNNGNIKFKGEYLNGKRWFGKGFNEYRRELFEIKYGRGIIKEYDYNGKLEFEGECINGKKNGKGIEYDHFSIINYIIEKLNFINSNFHGSPLCTLKFISSILFIKKKKLYYSKNI